VANFKVPGIIDKVKVHVVQYRLDNGITSEYEVVVFRTPNQMEAEEVGAFVRKVLNDYRVFERITQ